MEGLERGSFGEQKEKRRLHRITIEIAPTQNPTGTQSRNSIPHFINIKHSLVFLSDLFLSTSNNMTTSKPSFSASSTGLEVAAAFPTSIKGQTILITGVAQTGIGGSTAVALASQSPALLMLTGRSPSRVQPVIDIITSTYLSTRCKFIQLDLSSQSSVRTAAAEISSLTDHLEIIINNAGIMDYQTRELTPEGIELTFATNHIGHFLLTNLLIPKLLSSPSPHRRIINLTSFGHVFSPIRFSDLSFQTPHTSLPTSEQPNFQMAETFGIPLTSPDPSAPNYNPIVAYGQSKTANILFSLSLNSRLSTTTTTTGTTPKHSNPTPILSFAVHPGSIATDLQRHSDPERLARSRKVFMEKGFALKRKTLEEGCATTLVAACDPELKPMEGSGSVYLNDCRIEDVKAGWAQDGEAAERLWGVSEEMVGERFAWEV
ncbi:MAG: hypothetical protein Q9227_001161 [Pyrenula ochraceoflavens]